MNDDETFAEEQYDALADQWAAFTEVPWRTRILWPTMRSLLPPVAGKRVLDVGCGDGTYSRWFADRGADVVGVDLSREMIRVARETHGSHVEFRRSNLEDSLCFDDERFDLVFCQHVLSHLPALDGPFAEFARVLKPGGTVIVSTHNPVHDYLVAREAEYPDTTAIDGLDAKPIVSSTPERPTYHDSEALEIDWSGSESSNPATYYRRSLTALLQPLFDAGFTLQELIEPDLRDARKAEELDTPEEVLRRPPRSICFRATRPNP